MNGSWESLWLLKFSPALLCNCSKNRFYCFSGTLVLTWINSQLASFPWNKGRLTVAWQRFSALRWVCFLGPNLVQGSLSLEMERGGQSCLKNTLSKGTTVLFCLVPRKKKKPGWSETVPHTEFKISHADGWVSTWFSRGSSHPPCELPVEVGEKNLPPCILKERQLPFRSLSSVSSFYNSPSCWEVQNLPKIFLGSPG